MSVVLPAWRTAAQREREAELIFRGEQYARAVELYQRKYAGAFPPNFDVLLNEKFLRKKYQDPITRGEFQILYVGQVAGAPGQVGQQQAQGARVGQQGPAGVQAGLNELARQTQGVRSAQPSEFVPAAGQGIGGRGLQGGIMGVSSKATGQSLRLYNGRGNYNEWTFVATAASVQGGVGGQGGRAGARGGQDGRQGGAGRGGQDGRDGGAGRGGRFGLPPPIGFPGLGGAGAPAGPGRGLPQFPGAPAPPGRGRQ
jgi:hypothetical protein